MSDNGRSAQAALKAAEAAAEAAKEAAADARKSKKRNSALAVASLMVAILAAVFTFNQAQTASDAYTLERNLALRAEISDALSATLTAEQTALRLLASIAQREGQGDQYMLELGQLFEDRVIEASAAISSAQYITAHLSVSNPLEATRQRLEDARVATATLFGSVPAVGEERTAAIEKVQSLWGEVIAAANDARSTGYCDLSLGYEQTAKDAYCPHHPTSMPTMPPR